MRPATIVHTADVHLGTGTAGENGYEERCFARAIDLAIDTEADAVLIVGDLFDHARVPENLLAWTAKELDRAERPVILLVGNHDSLHDTSVHHRFDVAGRCTRVELLDDPDGSIVEVQGTDIVVWGRAMIEHEPAFRPLAGIPPKPEDKWGIVAGHGLVMPDEHPTHHGSPIAPSELAGVTWDYIALGHYHGHQVLQESPVPAVYPGATARSRKGEPGAVLVSFADGSGTTFEWVALSLQ
jgi:exonuclease SbcD